jgi:hypothetical protein
MINMLFTVQKVIMEIMSCTKRTFWKNNLIILSLSFKKDFQIVLTNDVYQNIYSTPNTNLRWL